MADLTEMLTQFLSSEEGKQQVNQVLSMLGQNGGGSEPPPPPPQQPQQQGGGMPDLSSLLSSLGLGGGGGGGPAAPSGNSGLPNLDISKLLRVQQLLSQKNDNSRTALLRALKPHLAEENRKKVDEAVRILMLLDLLPLIKESGLLGNLLGGDGG